MTTPFNFNTALDNDEKILVSTNRDAGLNVPRALPMHWDDLTEDGKALCLWYAHNHFSYFDKAALARHIIGVEILLNEKAGVSPVITKARADELWATVFSN